MSQKREDLINKLTIVSKENFDKIMISDHKLKILQLQNHTDIYKLDNLNLFIFQIQAIINYSFKIISGEAEQLSIYSFYYKDGKSMARKWFICISEIYKYNLKKNTHIHIYECIKQTFKTETVLNLEDILQNCNWKDELILYYIFMNIKLGASLPINMTNYKPEQIIYQTNNLYVWVYIILSTDFSKYRNKKIRNNNNYYHLIDLFQSDLQLGWFNTNLIKAIIKKWKKVKMYKLSLKPPKKN